SFGLEIFSFVLTCNDFTIRRENTWGSQFFIECVLVFSLADDLVIQFLCAYDFAKFFKSERVDIFFFMKNIGLYELFGFFQESLLINEVAVNHAVFWIFTITDEIPDEADHSFCLLGFLFTIR